MIEQNLKKLIFYYGATDHWAPVSYYEDMKKKFPDGEIYLCERKFKHAFVLESSEEVAEMDTRCDNRAVTRNTCYG